MLYDVLRNCHCPKINITLLENTTYSFLVFEVKESFLVAMKEVWPLGFGGDYCS